MPINLRGASAEERARYATLVRPARQRLGMRQAELATLADVDRTTVSNIERGAGAPQADVLRRLLSALGLVTDSPTVDLEVEVWLAMMESLLTAVPNPGRAAAADAALATLAHHVRTHGNESEVAATLDVIEHQTLGDHGTARTAAKRGTPRRELPHAD